MMKQEEFTNKAVADILRSVAAVYLLKNKNRFRIIAYENAADTVERMSREIRDIWKEGKLDDVPGIGPSISSHLDEYFKKGHSRHFDSVLKGIPESVFVLMRLPLLGPKRAYKLVHSLKLTNSKTAIEDLKKACLSGQVDEIPNFGEKSQQAILLSINLYERNTKKVERMPFPYAFDLAKDVIKYLERTQGVKRVDAMGSLRRMMTTIGDIDISAVADDKETNRIIEHFTRFPRTIKVDNAGRKKASIIVSPDIRIDLRIQDEKTYGAMLQYFTGSKSHNVKLREYALKKGLSLSEYGIKPLKRVHSPALGVRSYNPKTKMFEFSDEESFYGFLGLQYIPPEIREGTNEIELALKQKIPHLVELKDIKGDLHIHSSYDLKPSHDRGINTYEEMIEEAVKLKYEYIGFSEHNPNSSNNREQIIEIMKKRKDYLESLLQKQRLVSKIIIGLEVDILPDGNIALPEEAINYVDYLIVSVHSVFRQNSEKMTARVLKALSFPKVKILGHPTGRLIGRREGIEAEWEKIFDFAKKKSIAFEINSGADRLDLPDTLVRIAVENGNKFVIGTDAHAIEGMGSMFYGVSVARRGWATKSDIINIGSYEEVRKWIEK